VSYRAEFAGPRKLLIAITLVTLPLPAFCGNRWTAFGPRATFRVSAVRSDRSDPRFLYVACDTGVYVSGDGGEHWRQASEGLNGHAVLALEQAMGGTWVAGTDHGIFLLPAKADAWRSSNAVVNEQGTPRLIQVNGVTRWVLTHHPTRTVLDTRINAIEIAPNRWLAATSAGVYSSSDQGRIWSGGPLRGEREFIAIKAERELVAAATLGKLLVSLDGGTVWNQTQLPSPKTIIYDLTILPDSRIFVATRDGMFRSVDGGRSWQHLINGLPPREIGSIAFDSIGKRLLAYGNTSGLVFESADKGQNWRCLDNPGFGLQSITALNGRLFATTAQGLLAGPEKPQEDSAETRQAPGNWFLRLVHHSD